MMERSDEFFKGDELMALEYRAYKRYRNVAK